MCGLRDTFPTTTPTHPRQPARWYSYWFASQPARLCVKRMAGPFAYEPARWHLSARPLMYVSGANLKAIRPAHKRQPARL